MDNAPPLLITKLAVPRLPDNLVSRPRLVEMLDEGIRRGVVLISAPAGFGKTTLMCEWQTGPGRGQSLAWLALDEDDNDPARFLAYLAAALKQSTVMEMLHSSPPPPLKSVLIVLINALANLPGEIVLVLEDTHRVTAQPVFDALAYLVEHRPEALRLVLITRADPPLPLSRLRLRGALTEIRSSDLLFNGKESGEFLNQCMHLALDPHSLVLLQDATEGWIAGLQLAALSLQDRKDVQGLLAGHGDSQRYILDYLMDEVLSQLPSETQQFLLETALLEPLNGPLCDAVTGQQDGAARLAALQRANLFLVPLDEERHWYRYHHLFAESLRTRLEQTAPQQLSELHRRAAVWYAGEGLYDEALRHTVLLQDPALTARLVEDGFPVLLRQGRIATMIRWLGLLGENEIRAHPRLLLMAARAFALSGQLSQAEQYCRWVEESTPEINRTTLGQVSAIRATIAVLQGNAETAILQATRALDLLPAEDASNRSGVWFNLGAAYLLTGQIKQAVSAHASALDLSLACDNMHIVMLSAYHYGGLLLMQGRLHEGKAIFQRALQTLEQHPNQGAATSPTAGAIFAEYASLLMEWNRLDEAAELLARGDALSRQGGYMTAQVAIAMGYVDYYRLRGNPSAGLDAIQRAFDALQGAEATVLVRQMAAVRARLWVVAGDLKDAAAWEATLPPVSEATPDYLQEIETSVRIDLYLAQQRYTDALGLLDGQAARYASSGQTSQQIKCHLLRAVILQALGQTAPALDSLHQALVLAEPEGYLSSFIEAGTPAAMLLAAYRRQPGIPAALRDYAARLLAALRGEPLDTAPQPAQSADLPEPLTPRELEILRLMAGGATNQEIAARLILSLGTVKAHINHIMGKLAARNRTEAVLRGQALGLVE